MPKFYITFGQIHTHRINGKTFDRDCVAEVEAETEEAARGIFYPKFCFSYKESEFISKKDKMMNYFPRGVIPL